MKTRKDLHVELKAQLQELKHNKQILEGVKNGLLQYGILRGETQRIFMEDIELESLDARTLILLTQELYAKSNVFNLNPYGFFTEKEIKAARSDKSSSISQENESFPITIHNAIKKDERTFISFVQAKKLVSLYNSNLLEYNYSINKQYKFVKNIKGNLVKSIDINMKEVKEIAERISHNQYTIDKIILNVMVGSGSEGKEIEFKDDTLTIFQSQVDIITGLHDLSALAYVVEENPSIELKVEVEIKHYNLTDIKHFFNILKVRGGVN